MATKHNFRGNHKARTKVIDKVVTKVISVNPKESECCLCGGDMEYISVNRTTKIYGHNAEPLEKGHGRCCDSCNYIKVLSARTGLSESTLLEHYSKLSLKQ
jgi:hypothetical protein|tara:strand:+ start:217 stop:519 length:303 start_codon:yes stop_codon:yes gene_type:complete